jgi:glucuronokinase
MAGSSAIITACWRALMAFYQVEIPKHLLPSLVLSVENEELGIPAGLQDRVIQSYEGLVFMDFNRASIEKLGHGIYEELDPAAAQCLCRLHHPLERGHRGLPQRHPRPLETRR